jgi:type I restriction enzyme, S subunit
MAASKWKRYPNYSDKGIDWLGEVPEQWDISTPRLMFEEVKDKNTDSARTNFLSLVSKKGIIPYEEKGNMGNKMSVNIDHYTLVNKGDFVLNSMNFGIGGFGVSDYDGITSPAYVVLRPAVEGSLTRYIAKIFEDEGFQKGTAILGDGILELRRAIGWKHLKRQPIPIPSHEERIAIAKFLETGTNAIDGLIPALQNMIVKIEEKRSALITQAVTKGLNSDVTMKDTGLHWYPEAPSHWNLRKVKHIASIRPSNVDKKKYDGQEEVRLANYVDVYKNDWITEDLELMVATASGDEITKFSLMAGDMIITKDSETWDDIAVPAFVPKTMKGVVCGYHLTLIRPNQEHVLGEFLFRTYQALGVRDQYHYNANGVTRYGLGSYWVNNGVVPIPPINEQREIAEYIDRNLQIIRLIESNILSKIEKLKNYRTSLISAAVTGKIDVRRQA